MADTDALSDTTSPAGPADLAIGAFSDAAPWLVDPDAMTWRRSVTGIREAVHRSLPELTRPRKVPPGLRVVRVVRHLGVAVGGWALVERRRDQSTSRSGLSRRLRLAAEKLGPTYIKLGQIISSGEGLFPEELVTEFKKCRDQVPAESWSDVRAVVEAELGRPLESVFAEFDRVPLAAAS